MDLRRLQDSINQPQPWVLRFAAGGFLISINPVNPLPWFNDAVPVADPIKADVEEMVEVFRRHNRRPRLEFFRELWPHVPDLLESHGFRLKDTQPALGLERETWSEFSSEISVRLATPEDAEAINSVSDIAFEGDGPDPNRTAAIRDSLACGRSTAALAYLTESSDAVGSGRMVGMPDVREVISIGTIPEFRRRGVATAVTGTLLNDFFENGGEIAWLSAAPGAEGVYTRLGFVPVASQVCYVLD